MKIIIVQQFTIPQFIDVEDKIIGPVTTRQFLILLVTGLVLFIFYKLFDRNTFIGLSVVFGGMAVVVAFVRVGGQAFHYFLLNFIQTMRKPKVRVWNKAYTSSELNISRKAGMEEPEAPVEAVKAPRRAHIRDLSLIVNTGGFYRGDE